MTLKPVSSLSIKKAVNLYTIILFLSFGGLLYWLATERFQTLINSHEETARNTTNIVAFEIHKILKNKQHLIDLFIDNSKILISKLSADSENKIIFQNLKSHLRKYLPDFFAFNIMTSTGDFLVGDFNGDIGELDQKDLKYYIENRTQRIRLHSNRNIDHYDLISKQSNNGYIFFISFDTNELIKTLNSTQPKNHNLLLVNKEDNNLIEITSQNLNRSNAYRINYKMSGNEKLRTLSETKIKKTNWHVVDMRDEDLFIDYQYKILTECAIAYYIFILIALFMRNILLVQDKKRTTAEKQRHENNEKIKILNNRLEILSTTDGLTGLYNRRYFNEMINQEWNRGLRSQQPLSCILFDIDYFKDYNDYYGHQAGDKCLINISLVMKDNFKRAADVVARYGGEEFIIIMSNTSAEEAKSAIIKFQEELAKMKILHKDSTTNCFVTMSAGIITQIPSNDESIEDLIRKADKALYQAKDNGRNQWVEYK